MVLAHLKPTSSHTLSEGKEKTPVSRMDAGQVIEGNAFWSYSNR